MNHRTPPIMARLKYHPTSPHPEPGLWLLPLAILLAGAVLAWASAGLL